MRFGHFLFFLQRELNVFFFHILIIRCITWPVCCSWWSGRTCSSLPPGISGTICLSAAECLCSSTFPTRIILWRCSSNGGLRMLASISTLILSYLLVELLLDVSPDLTNFEVGIHLDYLDFLLLWGMEIIFGETCAVKNAENYGSQVIFSHFLLNFFKKISLCPHFTKLTETTWLVFTSAAETTRQVDSLDQWYFRSQWP